MYARLFKLIIILLLILKSVITELQNKFCNTSCFIHTNRNYFKSVVRFLTKGKICLIVSFNNEAGMMIITTPSTSYLVIPFNK